MKGIKGAMPHNIPKVAPFQCITKAQVKDAQTKCSGLCTISVKQSVKSGFFGSLISNGLVATGCQEVAGKVIRFNRMQSETAYIAPVPPPGDLDETTVSIVRLVSPPGELDETYASSLILSYSLHYIKT